MPRLLILSNGLYPDRKTGTPYWTSLVAHGLAECWDIVVLASSDDGSSPPADPIAKRIGAVRVLTWKEAPATYIDPIAQFFCPALDHALTRVLDRERPDTVLVMNFAGLSSTVVAELVRRRIPTFFFVNDVAPFCFEGYFSRPGEPCNSSRQGKDCAVCLGRLRPDASAVMVDRLRRWGQVLVRSFAGIAAPTRWFAERLETETCTNLSDRLQLIPCGLPPAIPGQRSNHEHFTVGFYGGRVPRKGGALLLEALALLRREAPTWPMRLRWYGGRLPLGDPHASVLHEHITVRHLVPVESLLAEFADVDVAVSASSGEVLPLILLQALQHRVPVIATDLGGYSEYLTHGHNALIVPQNARALADALSDLISGKILLVAPGIAVPRLEDSLARLDAQLRAPKQVSVRYEEIREAAAAAAAILPGGATRASAWDTHYS